MITDDREPVEVAEFTAHQRDAPDREHGVVLALGQGAGVVVDLGLGGGAGGAGFVIGGVAHPGRGVFGEDHLPHRPRLGGEVRAGRGHRVAALGGGGEVAFAVTFSVVGFGAVLIEQEQPQGGGLAQLFGSDADRDAHQVHLELRGGDGVDPATADA